MSDPIDDGGPAFPAGQRTEWVTNEHGATIEREIPNREGMSLRDYFAAKAMQALVHVALDVTKISQQIGEKIIKDAPAGSYEIADAMLKARKA